MSSFAIALAAEIPLMGPAGYHPNHGKRKRLPKILAGAALTDEGKPARLLNFHRTCGAAIYVGAHDFNGSHWSPRYFLSRDLDAPELQECTICGGPLRHVEPPHAPLVISAFAMERERFRARERLCAGAPLDAAAVAAIFSESEEGIALEDSAPLYGRTANQLRDELAAWLDRAQPREAPRS